MAPEMQFSTPEQTSTDYFEVWVRYQFQLYSRDGVILGEWPLTAYGKANTQNYGFVTTEPTLREAALAACRDAMAFFTVQFRTIPVVQQWLSAELLQGTPAPGQAQPALPGSPQQPAVAPGGPAPASGGSTTGTAPGGAA